MRSFLQFMVTISVVASAFLSSNLAYGLEGLTCKLSQATLHSDHYFEFTAANGARVTIYAMNKEQCEQRAASLAPGSTKMLCSCEPSTYGNHVYMLGAGLLLPRNMLYCHEFSDDGALVARRYIKTFSFSRTIQQDCLAEAQALEQNTGFKPIK